MIQRKNNRFQDQRRLNLFVIGVLVFWAILILRLVHIQIINKRKFVDMGVSQYTQTHELESARGIIYDRHLNCLAVNQSVYSIGVDVTKLLDAEQVARVLSRHLKKNEKAILRDFKSNRNFIWLAREVDETLVDRIKNEKIQGVHILKESRRLYPYKNVASQLVGFTNVDESGLSGVEYAFNNELHGKAGKAVVQQDALGEKLPGISYSVEKPTAGKDVVLTIDYLYQSIVEEELRHSVQAFGADGGIVVMLNPQTGEILSLACEPSFDCNHARSSAPDLWRNRAITDVFEPGSTFKPILMAAIIQEKLKSLDEVIFCENGQYKIYDQVYRDHKPYSNLTIPDILVNSSNIGMAKLARQIKPSIFFQYARDFGFGNLTNIELGGEIQGDLKHPVRWSETTPMAMSMGYEVAVTPIQLALAYATIANGGKLLAPQIIRQIGENVKNPGEIKPRVIRQVLTAATSRTLRDLLEQVVSRGTGKKAEVEGLRICGKTGTAHKYATDSKGYSPNEFLASFVGFFPAEKPEVLLCVMIDNPRTTYWGAEVAAPTFKRIVQRLLNVDNRFWMPAQKMMLASQGLKKNDKIRLTELPDFTNRNWKNSQEFLKHFGIETRSVNEGQIIIGQEPPSGTQITSDTEVKFTLFQFKEDSHDCVTPKVVGLSVREALNRLTLANIQAKIQGNGKVVRQEPGPGVKVKAGAFCQLDCRASIQPDMFPSW
ncbi:PASTA domain-containing protein [candidate division KSB1 bacterium]|nr:PASTA domain-containing protein [candidate division KSB1 bacterium]